MSGDLHDRIEQQVRESLLSSGYWDDRLQVDSAAFVAAEIAVAEFALFLKEKLRDLRLGDDA